MPVCVYMCMYSVCVCRPEINIIVFFYYLLACLLRQSPVSPQHPVLPSSVPWLQTHIRISDFPWILGFELWTSCLHSRYLPTEPSSQPKFSSSFSPASDFAVIALEYVYTLSTSRLCHNAFLVLLSSIKYCPKFSYPFTFMWEFLIFLQESLVCGEM